MSNGEYLLMCLPLGDRSNYFYGNYVASYSEEIVFGTNEADNMIFNGN